MIVTDQLIDIGETLGMQAARLQIARKMFIKKEPQEKVVEFTALTKEEIDQLTKELKMY